MVNLGFSVFILRSNKGDVRGFFGNYLIQLRNSVMLLKLTFKVILI